jgi:hypothetical protein
MVWVLLAVNIDDEVGAHHACFTCKVINSIHTSNNQRHLSTARLAFTAVAATANESLNTVQQM